MKKIRYLHKLVSPRLLLPSYQNDVPERNIPDYDALSHMSRSLIALQVNPTNSISAIQLVIACLEPFDQDAVA